MKVSLVQAKNGETTATINDIFLHSSYNPTREAERFVSNINLNYTPPYILITEPGLGYAIPLLRKRFPDSKIIIIRYSEDLAKYNSQGDYSFNYFKDAKYFVEFISNTITEDKLVNSLFLQWTPSSKIFNEYDKSITSQIKECLNNSKTLLITREFFEKKWLLNTVKFVKNIQHTIQLSGKINTPIIIISSGPSLKDVIQTLKENSKKFFIIALSSAIKVCLTNNIIPDLAISTDGGYWAGQHLKSLYKHNIPLALPAEGFIQEDLLRKNYILPLIYDDGLSSYILKDSGLQTVKAVRNGTVSGTALLFALNNSNNEIYFAGLDLCNHKGFQHCQPNELELNNNVKDCKINSLEKRATIGEFSQGVLDIYKQWFVNLKLNNRKVYRIINKDYKKNSLGEIIDISVNDFKLLIKKNIIKDNVIKKTNMQKNLVQFRQKICDNIKSNNWNNELYPLSTASLVHNKENMQIINRIETENNKLINKIGKILND